MKVTFRKYHNVVVSYEQVELKMVSEGYTKADEILNNEADVTKVKFEVQIKGRKVEVIMHR